MVALDCYKLPGMHLLYKLNNPSGQWLWVVATLTISSHGVGHSLKPLSLVCFGRSEDEARINNMRIHYYIKFNFATCLVILVLHWRWYWLFADVWCRPDGIYIMLDGIMGILWLFYVHHMNWDFLFIFVFCLWQHTNSIKVDCNKEADAEHCSYNLTHVRMCFVI